MSAILTGAAGRGKEGLTGNGWGGGVWEEGGGYVFLQGLALSIHELCPFQLEIVVDRKVTDRHGQPVLCAFYSRTVCSLPSYGLAACFPASQ